MLNWPLVQDPNAIFKWALDHFVWVPDQDVWQKPDFWATEIELEGNAITYGGNINDDCDGFAAMCVIACRKMRMPARFMVVATEKCPPEYLYDHCVAESIGNIFDNRYPAGLETRTGLEATGYRFVEMSGFHPGDDWTTIK